VVFCSNETAEIIKYAANSFLAVKISFINQMALLCEKTGADIETVARAVGMDKRINPSFLNPGPGYGGSCFPKDTKAIVKKAGELGIDLSIIKEADEANEKHKAILAGQIAESLKEWNGKTIAVWGLAFKAGTGDLRNSPALAIIGRLHEEGFAIKACDPKACGSAKTYFKSRGIKIEIQEDMYEIVRDADCLVILTEWPEFTSADMAKVLRRMRKPLLFDLRNIYERKAMEEKGFNYHAVGR
jgi:UDPglucose 6-dehydrogenase